MVLVKKDDNDINVILKHTIEVSTPQYNSHDIVY